MQTIIEIIGDPSPFLTKIFDLLKQDEIDVTNYELDHICYRVETIERYNDIKSQLNKIGNLLTESTISDRAISTFKLFEPIIHNNLKIWLIELPSPKEENFYGEGFEHVEFVIDSDFESFINKYPSINFDKKGLSKKVNPELRIKYGDVSVKFHHHNLEYVIKYLD